VFTSQKNAEKLQLKDKIFENVAWFKRLGMTIGHHKTPNASRPVSDTVT
jgi:hypothetical protein